MARYTYNSGLVTQTLEKLNGACKSISDTNAQIQKGMDMISNARGAENLQIDYSVITGYHSQVTEYIDTMSSEIKSKAQEIEEYESAPWWKKLFSTIGMGALKLVEGLASFVENIGDGLVSIVGFIGGIFSSDFRDCIGEFVKKDWVGDTVSNWYEDGWLENVDKYSIMAHDGTAANIFKGVGNAAGYVILSVATAGAGTAVSLGVSAGAGLAGGIGSGTESGLQAGKTFNQAFGQGFKKGAVSAATTLVVGGVANKLTAASRLANAGQSVDELTNGVLQASDDMNSSISTIVNNLDEGDELLSQVTQFGDKTGQMLDATEEVLKFADDGQLYTSAAIKTASAASKQSKDILKAAAALKETVKAGSYTDEVIAAVDDIYASAKNISTVAASTKTAIAGAQTLAGSGNVGSKLSKAGKLVAGGVKKVPIVGGVAKTAGKVLTSAVSSPIGTKAVELIAKAGPTVTNAVAAGAGAVTSGVFKDAIPQKVEIAPQSSTDDTIYTNESTDDFGLDSPTVNTEAPIGTAPTGDNTPAPNEQSPIANNSTPSTESSNSNNAPSNSGYSSSTQSNSGGGSTVQSTPVNNSTISAPELKEPTKNTSVAPETNTTITAPEVVAPNNTGVTSSPVVNSGQNTDSIVGTVNAGSSNFNSSPSSVLEQPTVLSDEETNEVLLEETFGNVSTSLGGLTSQTNSNIPTSSAPLTSTNVTPKSSSFIPIGAGLGAATISGIGAKTYMDKREKDKEEKDSSIETDNWEDNETTLNIDYDTISESTPDYLTPTDEYAYHE